MKKSTKWIIPIIISIISIITPLCWDLFKEDKKELTILQERKIDFPNAFGDSFDIYTKDSLKLNDYNFSEYSIINTGNKTIIGFGTNSDILTDDNSLCIAPDSIIINLSNNNIAILDHNHIRFQQIRPGEKISLLCTTSNKTDCHVLSINDRDIKDTNIKYVTYADKITTFEKTSIENKWWQAIAYSANLLGVIVFIIISLLWYIDSCKGKRKLFVILWITLWLICLTYTLSLPIRWLL